MANHNMGARNRRRRRARLYEMQGGLCAICGGPMPAPGTRRGHKRPATLDHKIPFSWGGSNGLWNLQLAHRRCNERKGDRAAERGSRADGEPTETALGLALKRAGMHA